MKATFLSIAVLASVLSAPAFADDSVLGQQNNMVQMLLKYDTNADGILSRDELVAGKTAEFKAADVNVDTLLSWAEFKAMLDAKQATRVNSLLSVMDADASGGVTVEEFAAAVSDKTLVQATTVFKLIAGLDGLLSAAELATLSSADTGRQVWDFARLDKDADGQLSVTEFTEAPAKPAISEKPKQPKQPKQPEKPTATLKPTKPVSPTTLVKPTTLTKPTTLVNPGMLPVAPRF